MRSEPAHHRLVKAQAGEQAHDPSEQIERAANETTPPAVKRAQQHYPQQQDVNYIEGHLLLNQNEDRKVKAVF